MVLEDARKLLDDAMANTIAAYAESMPTMNNEEIAKVREQLTKQEMGANPLPSWEPLEKEIGRTVNEFTKRKEHPITKEIDTYIPEQNIDKMKQKILDNCKAYVDALIQKESFMVRLQENNKRNQLMHRMDRQQFYYVNNTGGTNDSQPQYKNYPQFRYGSDIGISLDGTIMTLPSTLNGQSSTYGDGASVDTIVYDEMPII